MQHTFLQTLRLAAALSLMLGATLALPAMAQDVGELDKEKAEKAYTAKPPYSPYVGRNFPTRPFFGDTHLHTAFSMDAGAFGARLTPRDAYVFAKGNEITASSGRARQAVPAARFSRRGRSLGRYGLFPAGCRRRSQDHGRPARPKMVRHDPLRQGGGGSD